MLTSGMAKRYGLRSGEACAIDNSGKTVRANKESNSNP